MTYGQIVVDHRPETTNPYRTRLTVGGDRFNYPENCGTPTVGLTTAKIFLNIIVSTLNKKLMTIDINDFYSKTPMACSEYMRLKLSDLSNSVVQHYNLDEKTTREGYVYEEINRGMYGITQEGLIAQQLLGKGLNKKCYHQSEINPEIWKQKWRLICFSLCVDDFGVKYVGKHHAEHLMSVLKKYYKIPYDWEGKGYLGLDFDWYYSHRKVHL